MIVFINTVCILLVVISLFVCISCTRLSASITRELEELSNNLDTRIKKESDK